MQVCGRYEKVVARNKPYKATKARYRNGPLLYN